MTCRRRALLWGLWFALGTARAGDCDIPVIDWSAPSVSDRDRLIALTERCPNDADVFAALGALQFTLGDPVAAQVSLERALLLNPAHFGARIDLGLTLHALGQRQAARALLRPVIDRRDLPDGVAERIIPVLAVPRTRPAGRHQLAVSTGYSSNRNLGARIDQLTLTLPQGRLTLPVDALSRPDPGVVVPYRYQYDHPNGFGVEFRGVHSPGGPGRRQALEAQWQGGNWRASFAHEIWEGNELGQFGSFSWAPLGELRDCNTAPLVQIGYQRYAAAPELSGGVARFGATRTCDGLGIFGALIYDVPDSDERPGGSRLGIQAVARWQGVWNDVLIDASVGLTHLRDGDGYSPLIENGERRRLTRLTPLIEARYRLGKGRYLAFELEHEQQMSNLPLFDLRRTQATFGLLSTW